MEAERRSFKEASERAVEAERTVAWIAAKEETIAQNIERGRVAEAERRARLEDDERAAAAAACKAAVEERRKVEAGERKVEVEVADWEKKKRKPTPHIMPRYKRRMPA